MTIFPDKLKTAVQYVAFKSISGELNDIRLNVILWFADIHMHMKSGETITGWQYLKRMAGPELEHYEELIAAMEAEGILTVTSNNSVTRVIDSYELPRDGEILSSMEIELLDRFIAYGFSVTPEELSNESRDK